MRERALAIGARLDLRSGSAEGTQVTISWGDGEWGEGDEPLVSD
jgi:nitrate/nitrite-specific signal transduction histidine kinase